MRNEIFELTKDLIAGLMLLGMSYEEAVLNVVGVK